MLGFLSLTSSSSLYRHVSHQLVAAGVVVVASVHLLHIVLPLLGTLFVVIWWSCVKPELISLGSLGFNAFVPVQLVRAAARGMIDHEYVLW